MRLQHALIEAEIYYDERSRKFIASFFIDIQRLPGVVSSPIFRRNIYVEQNVLLRSARGKSGRKNRSTTITKGMNIDFFLLRVIVCRFSLLTHISMPKKQNFFVLVLFVVTSSVIIPVASLKCANRKIEPAQKEKLFRKHLMDPFLYVALNFQSTHTTDMQYLHVRLDGHVIRMETKVNSTRVVGMQLVA